MSPEEPAMTDDYTPTATDALRRWLFHAGFGLSRRSAALDALDAFDAALRGAPPATDSEQSHRLRADWVTPCGECSECQCGQSCTADEVPDPPDYF